MEAADGSGEGVSTLPPPCHIRAVNDAGRNGYDAREGAASEPSGVGYV